MHFLLCPTVLSLSSGEDPQMYASGNYYFESGRVLIFPVNCLVSQQRNSEVAWKALRKWEDILHSFNLKSNILIPDEFDLSD
jgi:hypothetical protein